MPTTDMMFSVLAREQLEDGWEQVALQSDQLRPEPFTVTFNLRQLAGGTRAVEVGELPEQSTVYLPSGSLAAMRPNGVISLRVRVTFLGEGFMGLLDEIPS
jgi:hypothetical protein